MSLTSLLGPEGIGPFLSLVLFPLKPAIPQKTARELELEAELERANFALNHWRTSWHALWADNERLRGAQLTQTQQLVLEHYRMLNDRLKARIHATDDRPDTEEFIRNCSPSRANALGAHPAEPLPQCPSTPGILVQQTQFRPKP